MKKLLVFSVFLSGCSITPVYEGGASSVPYSVNRDKVSQAVLEAHSRKSDVTFIVGANTYTATYNGFDSSGKCELVSVVKGTMGHEDYVVDNYRVCDGQVAFLGRTGTEPEYYEREETFRRAEVDLLKKCKLYGRASVVYLGNVRLECRAVDPIGCRADYRVLENDFLVKREAINLCKGLFGG